MKSIHFGYKMTHTLTSYNPIHLMFYYISRPFFVFLGPTLVNLGAILGMIKHSKALKLHKFVFLNSLSILNVYIYYDPICNNFTHCALVKIICNFVSVLIHL